MTLSPITCSSRRFWGRTQRTISRNNGETFSCSQYTHSHQAVLAVLYKTKLTKKMLGIPSALHRSSQSNIQHPRPLSCLHVSHPTHPGACRSCCPTHRASKGSSSNKPTSTQPKSTNPVTLSADLSGYTCIGKQDLRTTFLD